ncbi:MAG: hypothetical protein BGO49_10430 [Planctomycetales bacterium 71-10]|nr:MAG: hypothetical protein BGO49_10430 [Planctomycetales bacterium 71-10]
MIRETPPLLARLLDRGTPAALSDAQLAERFAATRDPEAFAAIVERHGPLVLATCRGVLGADAEDAFQATFLVLMNRIGTFPVRGSLAGWLHRVARRIARDARRSQARRRLREEAAGARRGPGPDPGPERSELLDAVRREVDRLPERYRAPIVLCDLEGLTREEAAAALGCPAGTIGGRLARARRKLREALERRGLDPSSAPIPIAPAASAGWKFAVETASRSAASLAAGARPTPAAIDLAAQAAGAWAPIKPALALATAAFLAGGLLAAAGPSGPPPRRAAPAPAPGRSPEPRPPVDPDDPATAGRYAGRVVDREGRPIAGARLFIARRSSGSPAAEIGPVRGRSGPDGSFEFDAPDLTVEAADLLPRRRQGLLVAAADGYAPDWDNTWGEARSTFRSHWDPIKGADLTLRLVPDVPIRGRIVDPDGRPVAGARVHADTLTIPDRDDLDAYLKQVTSAFGGSCHIHAIRPRLLPGAVVEATTDADGRFRLSGLGGERIVSMTVAAAGFAEGRATAVTRETPDVPSVELDGRGQPLRTTYGASFTASLEPDRTVAVSGVVIDRDTREPLAGVRVGRDNWMERLAPDDVVTGPDGRFTVRGVRPEELDAAPPPYDHLEAPAGRKSLRLAAAPEPGRPYLPASMHADRRDGLVIECLRGIPFRLKVVDEEGRPVDAEVESRPVTPNPWLRAQPPGAVAADHRPAGRAVKTAPGVYEGVATPGPGALLVQTPSVRDLRPPFLNPKAFFAPGKLDWTDPADRISYGDRGHLNLGHNWLRQEDYAAIVLVDPPAGSGPLELSATVVRDRPRLVNLLDPEGRPLVGVDADGLLGHAGVPEPRLRAAVARITKLDPSRPRVVTFRHEGRKLAGSLLARGDGDAPYTVTLRPWAAVTGRVVDAQGRPTTIGPRAGDDPEVGAFPIVEVDAEGRFRIDRLAPGLRYDVEAAGQGVGVATDLILAPGEVRDLGDVRLGGAR